jgi:hypothetical protein
MITSKSKAIQNSVSGMGPGSTSLSTTKASEHKSVPKWILVTDEMDTSVDGEQKAPVSMDPSLGDPSPPAYTPAPSRVLGSLGYQPQLALIRGKGHSTGIDLPPSTNVVAFNKHTFRFLSLSSNLGTVTVGTLLAALGTVGTTVIQTTNWNASVKLHSIKVWPPAGSSAFVEWVTTGGYAKDEIKDSSLPSGVTVTKSLTFSPPRSSFAALWQANVGNTLFKMFAPTGSIIDVHVSYCPVGSFAPNNNVVASASLGSIYYLYLDGSATKYYQPVALPTTV